MNNQKGIAPLVVILMIAGILVLGGGAYYFQKSRLTGSVTPSAGVQPSTEQPSATSTSKVEGETANLETYRNEDYGFEFQYPSDKLALVPISKEIFFDSNPFLNGKKFDGVKLISLGDKKELGESLCSYGESGLTSVCVAEQDEGIEFLFISSDIGVYLNKARYNRTINVGEKNAQLFYTAGVENEGIFYYGVSLPENKGLVFGIEGHYTSECATKQDYLYENCFAGIGQLFSQIIPTIKFTK